SSAVRSSSIGPSECGDRARVLGGEHAVARHRQPEVAQAPVLEAVNPAVHRERLRAPPRVHHDRRPAHVGGLAQHVQLREPGRRLRVGGAAREVIGVLLGHVLHVPQPVVDQSQRGLLPHHLDPAAAVVAADDHVLDLQHVDGVLEHRQAVQVRVDDDVGDVAVNEELARQEAHDLVGRHAAVGAPDPEEARRLLPRETVEKARIPFVHPFRPAAVVLEQLRDVRHVPLPYHLAVGLTVMAHSSRRVLVVGLGTMGRSHASAYARIPGFEIAGLCSRGIASLALPPELRGAPTFASFDAALAATKPDVVSINTLPDTHAAFAIRAMESGAHVFVEKPIAETVEDAQRVADTAVRTRRKLVIGYILRPHPSWIRFIELARTLGPPYIFRMNLNQQSSGPQWEAHQRLLTSLSPIVDCGVHYVDVWCQITSARPTTVHAVGARLTDHMRDGMYNYGQLHVTFDDGSVGWYEAGWGPMMSETAFFVKDVIGPQGSVSIVLAPGETSVRSDDINAHTQTNQILLHHATLR